MTANRVSITITDAQKTNIKTATAALATATANFTTAIDKDTLNSLSTIADGRIPFVEKVAQYAVSNPEFLQPLADVGEFQTDLKAFKDLREVVLPMRIVVNNMTASMRVSGSEAWNFARNFYSSLQFHARMGVPGAQTILDELRPLFEGKTNSDDDGDDGDTGETDK
jgi:hypothetical protein